jgi:hypothetical protein
MIPSTHSTLVKVPNTRRLPLACLFLACAAFALPVDAQLIGPVPDPVPATVQTKPEAAESAEPRAEQLARLLRDLDSEALETRERATRGLADLNLGQEELEAALRTPGLSPEQRARLGRLGPGVLYSTPRGALGVSFNNGRDELRISSTIEGFDSCRVLRSGDEIEAIEGHRVTSTRDRRAPIIMNPPGTEISVKVVREGTPRTFRVRLGDFSNLNGGRWDRVSLSDCAEAWALRTINLKRDGLIAGVPARVDAGLDAETWHRASVDAGVRDQNVAVPEQQSSNAVLLAGGQPRIMFDSQRPADGEAFNGQGSDPIGLNAQLLIKQDPRFTDILRLQEIQRQLAGNRLDAASRDRLLAEMQDVTNRLFDLNDDRPLPRIP